MEVAKTESGFTIYQYGEVPLPVVEPVVYEPEPKEFKVPETNDGFVELIKGKSIELRKTGLDIDEHPTLELGLLCDLTGSMASWINRAKNTLFEIIETVEKECKEDGDVKIRVSFIGYRDFGDEKRFACMPFTDDIQKLKDFISNEEADGGQDEPEDMQGGLKLALLQDWTDEASKRCVLITDAPPHGQKYHDTSDDYPEGSPEGIVLEDIMKEFCQKEINFQVIKLNYGLEKMIEAMKSVNQELEVTDMSNMQEDDYYRGGGGHECEEDADAMPDYYYRGGGYEEEGECEDAEEEGECEDAEEECQAPPRRRYMRKPMVESKPSKMDKMFIAETSAGMVKDFKAMKSKKGKC